MFSQNMKEIITNLWNTSQDGIYKEAGYCAASLEAGWSPWVPLCLLEGPAPGVPRHLMTPTGTFGGEDTAQTSFCLSLFSRCTVQSVNLFIAEPVLAAENTSPLQPRGSFPPLEGSCYSPLLRGFSWQGLLLSPAAWSGCRGDALSGALWPPQQPTWGSQCTTQRLVVTPWCFSPPACPKSPLCCRRTGGWEPLSVGLLPRAVLLATEKDCSLCPGTALSLPLSILGSILETLCRASSRTSLPCWYWLKSQNQSQLWPCPPWVTE